MAHGKLQPQMNSNTRFNQLLMIGLAALLAISLAALSWPRMKASYRFLPVDIAIGRYYQQREIPSHRMQTLIGFARQAIEFHDHYRYHEALSLLHFLRGVDIRTPALERRPAYREAETAALVALQRAPARPETWMRVATVRSILRDEPEDIIQAWKMSVFTGRTHSTLLVPRVAVGVPFAGFMDAESRSMLRDQLLLAWELKPADLLRTLKQRDPRLEITRSLVQPANPTAFTEMEARIEKIR
jgi:hypothetical protein